MLVIFYKKEDYYDLFTFGFSSNQGSSKNSFSLLNRFHFKEKEA